LTGWDLAGKNLMHANFYHATLNGADLAGAIVKCANFSRTTHRGFTAQQLYTTESYHSGDLSGINLAENDLTGWDLAGKNLSYARLYDAWLIAADLSGANLAHAYLGLATLTGANLSLSDLRGSYVFLSSAASTKAAILPDGRIERLVLDEGERLVVRDYDGEAPVPITIELAMNVDPQGALRMVFEDDSWGSTISFQPEIEVALAGTLELMFAEEVSPPALVGTTFDLFDWERVVIGGQFHRVVSECQAVWDTSRLYSTGEVTLLSAVPEPSTPALLFAAATAALVGLMRRR
jgi:hypothetical protein